MGRVTGVYEDTVKELRFDLNPVDKVTKGQLFSMPTQELVRRNDKLYRIIQNK